MTSQPWLTPRISDLPVEGVIPDLIEALNERSAAVLVAEPGAGKTTVVPLYLLRALSEARGGQLLLLEPRRVAVRAAARRLAQLLGEDVGHTVGFVTRTDRSVSAASRIVVMTEGVFVRRLQADSHLPGVAGVIFDEFHERSVNADLGLAMARDVQQTVRPDLHILVMSATIDGEFVARYLDEKPVSAPNNPEMDATIAAFEAQFLDGEGSELPPQAEQQPTSTSPVPRASPAIPTKAIFTPGRTFPVDIKWSPAKPKERFEATVLRAIDAGLRHPGDLLVFLPGVGEIRSIARSLDGRSDPAGTQLDVREVYGAMSAIDQDMALWGAANGRRVVLATNIAETSLTVEGIGVVVDGGMARSLRFDSARGIGRLKLLPISRASADQRSGRAGRLGPGVAIRCWSKVEHGTRPKFTPPEIQFSDFASARLTMLRWAQSTGPHRTSRLGGAVGHDDMPLLSPPPDNLVTAADRLLNELGAVSEDGILTPVGVELEAAPLHPRLATMVKRADESGNGWLACIIATLLSERDILRPAGTNATADLRVRVTLVEDVTAHHPHLDVGAVRSVRQQAGDLAHRMGIATVSIDVEATGPVLAIAYPDKIATAQGSLGRFALEGTSAWVATDDPLRFSPILAVAEADPRKKERRIRLAAPLI